MERIKTRRFKHTKNRTTEKPSPIWIVLRRCDPFGPDQYGPVLELDRGKAQEWADKIEELHATAGLYCDGYYITDLNQGLRSGHIPEGWIAPFILRIGPCLDDEGRSWLDRVG